MATPLNVPIILASGSPRRIDLLNQLQIRAEIMAPQIDETARPRETPRQLVKRLAREKALAVGPSILWKFGSGVIIAADTIVVAPNGRKLLGKPTDAEDARRMLRALSGKTHTVLTGYCILTVAREMKPQALVKVVSSKVKMRPLGEAAIDRYVSSGEPMDKAGAYAAQGLGMALIERISGSYANVVGLPVCQLLRDLEKKFGTDLFSWI